MEMNWEKLSAGNIVSPDCKKLIFAADWAPIRHFESVMADDPTGCYGDTLEVLQSADLRIVNFECTVQGKGTPVRKGGPNLAAAEMMVRALDRGDLDWREIVNPIFKDGKKK